MRKIIVRTYLLFNIKQFITRRPHIPQDPSLHYPKKGFYHQGPGHKGCHEVTALETFTLSTISLQHSSKAFYQGILFKQKSVQFNRGRGGDKWRTVLGGDVVQNKPRIWNNVILLGHAIIIVKLRQGSARDGLQGERPQSLKPCLELTLKLVVTHPPPTTHHHKFIFT